MINTPRIWPEKAPLLLRRMRGLFLVLYTLYVPIALVSPRFTAPACAAPVPLESPVLAALPAPSWHALIRRLEADGLYGPDVEAALLALPEGPSSLPMGRKLKEVYTRQFVKPPPPPPDAPPRPPRPTLYPGVVTADNIALCRDFLKTHKTAFDVAEKRFQVPRHIAVALLFVETRLGTYLGKESAFNTLASMAASRSPEYVADTLAELPETQNRMDWINDLLRKRSDWAYKELAALIANLRESQSPLSTMPGSIYGAIGLCQFMPSNVLPYGADGNGDGHVNLFEPADAIASLSNYLVKNGWKGQLSRDKRHAVLKTYNRINIYANTILALAEGIEDASKPPSAKPTLKGKTSAKAGSATPKQVQKPKPGSGTKAAH